MSLKRNAKGSYILAILINLGLIALFFLLFEPTTKSDDYDMMNVLYGGYNGEYSPFMLYVNPLYGYLLRALVRSAPALPWYTIVQYGLMLWGMTEITNIFLKKTHSPLWILVGLLSFIYYECFIRITFTKTAGLLIACGFMILFYQIDSLAAEPFGYLKGIALIFLGHLIRSRLLGMIMEVYAGAFLILILSGLRCRRAEGDWKNRLPAKVDPSLWRKTLIFAVMAALILFVGVSLNNIGNRFYDNDVEWKDYRADNSKRARLFDYGFPDYYTFQAEYEALGISYNDYKLWFGLNMRDDQELLTFDLMSEIRKIANHEFQIESSEQWDYAWHDIIKWCLNNTMFFFFICCSILVLATNRMKKAAYVVSITVFTCLVVYFVLYLRGRTQHHVDAIVFIAGSFILIYNCAFQNTFSYKRNILISACLLTVCFVNVYDRELRSSSYYGASFGNIVSQKEQYRQNKHDLDLLVDDGSRLYLFNANDTNLIYPAFTVWETIPRMYYHNLHRLNMDDIPIHKDLLSDFTIENPFREIIDSNTMYFYISNFRNGRGDADVLLTYLRENYNENTVMDVVKTTEQGLVYRFYTEKLTVQGSTILDPTVLKRHIKCHYNEQNNEIIVDGYVFEEQTDSFAQNVYIKVTNDIDNSVIYYPTMQGRVKELQGVGKYNGEYSAFTKNITIDSGELPEYSISVILENEHGIYTIPIIYDLAG